METTRASGWMGRISCSLATLTCVLTCLFILPGPCSAASSNGESSVEKQGDGEPIAAEIYRRINLERKKQRLTPLLRGKTLDRIAQSHSDDMAGRGYFSHESPDGESFLERYQREGFACRARKGNVTSLGAENLALDHRSQGGRYTASALSETIVRRWMASRGHRENILSRHHASIGIGVALAADGTVYVTANFC